MRACKWVDEVAEGTEYTVTLETLARYNCDYYAHGDDTIYDADGNDICALFKKHNKFKMFKRTEGVSTTDIIGKLLMLTRESRGTRGRTYSMGSKPVTTTDYVKTVRRNTETEEELKIPEKETSI